MSVESFEEMTKKILFWLSPEYCEVANKRVEEALKQTKL